MRTYLTFALVITAALALRLISSTAFPGYAQASDTRELSYPIVDTGQPWCYAENGTSITCPTSDAALFGQDANYIGNAPAYIDNGDGTITDLNTGLMWQQTPSAKVTWDAALANAETLTLGGYDDWRVPTIKELYSLITFNGVTGRDESTSVPYLDTTYFDFTYGDTSAGERMIDAQYWSGTQYVSTTMNNIPTVFGVNFADGRIKGYGLYNGRGAITQFVRYVRGGTDYGVNDFADNGDGTITDQATGLMWQQSDSGSGMLWTGALSYCETLDSAGYNDWRLPNAKELQSIVDYTRSLETTGSPAIDPLFDATPILDPEGDLNYAYYWTSTTHLDGANPGIRAVYIAFGEAQGYMTLPQTGGSAQLMDVHGAGAQRSDPKSGDPANYAQGLGPQGDVITIYNMTRCVRGGDVTVQSSGGTDPRTHQSGGTMNANAPGAVPANGPDLTAAAARLGTSEAALRAALGAPPPDLTAAAAKLGVTEQALIAALGVPAQAQMPRSGPPPAQ